MKSKKPISIENKIKIVTREQMYKSICQYNFIQYFTKKVTKFLEKKAKLGHAVRCDQYMYDL